MSRYRRGRNPQIKKYLEMCETYKHFGMLNRKVMKCLIEDMFLNKRFLFEDYDRYHPKKYGKYRCRSYRYFSRTAGAVSLRGTWEVHFAVYLDRVGKKWERNKDRFPYVLDNKGHHYIPDFKVWLDDGSIVYYEVKGIMSPVDEVKIASARVQGVNLVVVMGKNFKEFDRQMKVIV